jgi:hypothetical protein
MEYLVCKKKNIVPPLLKKIISYPFKFGRDWFWLGTELDNQIKVTPICLKLDYGF